MFEAKLDGLGTITAARAPSCVLPELRSEGGRVEESSELIVCKGLEEGADIGCRHKSLHCGGFPAAKRVRILAPQWRPGVTKTAST